MKFDLGEPYIDGIGGLGAVENQFDSSAIIGKKLSIARYAINGIALLILLFTRWPKKKRNNSAEKLKDNYGWLLLLLIVAFILLIVNRALTNANVIGIFGSTCISSAVTGVRGAARLLLLVILCYITPHVFEQTFGNSIKASTAKFINIAFCVAVFALWITALVLTYVATYADENASLKVVKLAHRVSVAYYALYFIAAVMASGILASAMVPAWINLTTQTKSWLVFTLLMFLIYNVANMVGVFGAAFKDRHLSEANIIVFMVFDSIVTSLMVFGIPMFVDDLLQD